VENSEVFEELGLTPGERKCYLALLETGITSAGPLVKRTGMQKSAVYFCLEKLLEKGLASFVIRNNVKQFEAAKPARIMDYLDVKEAELQRQREVVRKILPELEKIVPIGEKNIGRMYEGWEGVKSAFDDVLATLKAGDEYLVFSIDPPPEVLDRVRRFIGNFHAQRVKRKIPMQGIMSENLRSTLGRDREAQNYTQIKYAPPGYSTPAVISIYADKILITVWAQHPSAFVIQNREVAESFRNYFHILWKQDTWTYRGLDGMRTLLEETLNHKEVKFIGGGGYVHKYLKDYFEKQYAPEAKKRGIVWRNVGRPEMRESKVANAPFVKMRYLPAGTLSPATPSVIWLYGKKVVNVLWGEEPVAFSIENESISRNYNEYFELLWKSAGGGGSTGRVAKDASLRGKRFK
jgi:sugar-specific transcriptional regulator TrmB